MFTSEQLKINSVAAVASLVLLVIATRGASSQSTNNNNKQQNQSWMFDEAKQCLGNDGKQASLDKIQPELYYFQVGQNRNSGDKSPRHIFKLGYNDQEFTQANINSSLPIKVIAHGFDNSFNATVGNDDWIQNMIDVLDISPSTSYNVFVFNWPNGFVRERQGLISGYGIVAGTTRTLGSYLGSFLTRMNKALGGVRFDQTQLIGHSLGAHVVGFAGKYLKQNLPSGVTLARITGLDPAGPCFQLAYQKNRIDAQDANYVDIIHSNAGLLGAIQQIGKRDVYLNGGSLQPGCTTWDSTCSHMMAYNVMIYEPMEQCHMVAYQCKNYDEFSRGACLNCQADESRCTLVNFPINFNHDEYEPKVQNKLAVKPDSTELDQAVQENLVTGMLQNSFRIFKSFSIKLKEPYYVNTGDNLVQSYCLQHYQVKLFTNIPKQVGAKTPLVSNNRTTTTNPVTNNQQQQVTVDKVMLINDNSSNGQENMVTMNKLTDLNGNRYAGLWTGLLTYDGDIQTFNRAVVTINNSLSNSLDDEPIIMGATVEFMSHICPKKRQLYSSVLCSSNLINMLNNDNANSNNNNNNNNAKQISDNQQKITLEACNHVTSNQLESMFSAAPRTSKSITDVFRWFG